MTSLSSLIWNALFAAATANGSDRHTWTVEDICVLAWKKHPEQFGMKGYQATYPDLRKVVATMSGKHGMVKKGLLLLSGFNAENQTLYRLGTAPEFQRQVEEPPSIELMLVRQLLQTDAVRKATTRQEPTAVDAMQFFGVSLRSGLMDKKPWEMASRLRQIDASDGVSREDRQLVLKVAEGLLERFCRPVHKPVNK